MFVSKVFESVMKRCSSDLFVVAFVFDVWFVVVVEIVLVVIYVVLSLCIKLCFRYMNVVLMWLCMVCFIVFTVLSSSVVSGTDLCMFVRLVVIVFMVYINCLGFNKFVFDEVVIMFVLFMCGV